MRIDGLSITIGKINKGAAVLEAVYLTTILFKKVIYFIRLIVAGCFRHQWLLCIAGGKATAQQDGNKRFHIFF